MLIATNLRVQCAKLLRCVALVRDGGAFLTPSNSIASRRWRGITVTSSISQMNATSAGLRPGAKGRAMVVGEDEHGVDEHEREVDVVEEV